MQLTLALPFLSLLSGLTTLVQATDFWTVNCAPLSVQQSDPIVNPGEPSKHVHAISGGTAFSRNMIGNDSAVRAKRTTCDKFTDHSNYWTAQLYNRRNGKFELVPYTGVNIYYKRLTCDYNPNERWCPTKKSARAFPPGLRILAGDSTRRTYNPNDQSNQAILFDGGLGEKPGFPQVLSKNIQMNVRFPSCWDGKNVDSPDHKSHVAYPDPAKGDTAGGMCPQSHPIALIHMGAEFGFDTNSLGLRDTSTLVFSNGDTTGFGGHADFLQGWTNLKALAESFDNCDGPGEACAWNKFGTPDGKMATKSPQTPEVAPLHEEDIGLNGPIDKLPGNNPVYVPGQAIPSAAPTTSASRGSTPLPASSALPASSSGPAPKPTTTKAGSSAGPSPSANAQSNAGPVSTRIVEVTRTVAVTKTTVETKFAVVTRTRTKYVCDGYKSAV